MLKYKKGQVWIGTEAMAEQFYFYRYPFQFTNYFKTWKNKYQLHVKIQVISATSLKKRFRAEEFLNQSKKNQQCDLIEIESKIKEDSRLVKIAEKAGKNEKIQQDLNSLAEQLRLGNKSPGTGTKTLFKGVKEARARSGARLYFREKNGKIEVLVKLTKNSKDRKDVVTILRKKYE
jgi:hypothetical protein